MAFVDLNDAVLLQVREAADIAEIVGQVTPLRQAGHRMKGLCPFHREKTPSFSVDRDKGLFYCFGCGTGGDVFKFVMLTERMTFPEAVEFIAGRVGIQLPRKSKRDREGDKDDLLELIEEAAGAFHQALSWTPNPADSYLLKRQVDATARKKYGFGYAPDSWDYVLSRLGRKYAPQKLEAAGLALPRKSGDGFYDRFRNRLIVPIHSETGTILGFGGRSLDGSDPKYLNSPESTLFNKSRLLYNLHRAKEQMRKLDRAILVEGYFDCISLDYAGVPGVVASMGTSLTTGQAALLRKFARYVVIAYDGDEAGRNATLRAAPVLMSAGLNVGVIDVGKGEDPDTFIKSRGSDGFLELLGNAVDVFDFALQRLAPNPAALSGREKSERLDTIGGLLASVSDPVVRNDAAQRVANGLRLEFETVWSKIRGPVRSSVVEPQTRAPISTSEKQLLGAAVRGELDPTLAQQLREDYFEDTVCKTLYSAIKERIFRAQPLDFSGIATDLRGEAELTLLSELALGDEVENSNPRALEETIRQLERRYLQRRQLELQHAIQEAERVGDHARVTELDAEKLALSRQLYPLK